MNYLDLKTKHRECRNGLPESLSLRVHRSLSWLNKSELSEDLDSEFIFLWISFNAAYATDLDHHLRLSEQASFRQFLEKLCSLDTDHFLETLVWNSYSSSIRLILNNQYLCPSFWEYQRGKVTDLEWKEGVLKEKKFVAISMGQRRTAAILGVVLGRIYVLRNQLFHGFSTWDGAVNREQLKLAIALMSELVPLLIKVMIDNPDTLWGDASYPVVERSY